MSNHQKEVSNFVLCITTFPHEEKYLTSRFEIANNGVPTEIIIAQVEAYLHNLKREYFDGFDSDAIKFREE